MEKKKKVAKEDQLLEFSMRIKKLLEESGLGSQAAVADKLQVEKSAVGKWYRGESWPSAKALIGLSMITHKSIDFLLTGNCSSESLKAGLSDDDFLLLMDVAYILKSGNKTIAGAMRSNIIGLKEAVEDREEFKRMLTALEEKSSHGDKTG